MTVAENKGLKQLKYSKDKSKNNFFIITSLLLT